MTEHPVDMSSAALDRRLRELAELWRFWRKLRQAQPIRPGQDEGHGSSPDGPEK